MTDRLRKARNWLSRAEQEWAAYEIRKAEGKTIGLYDDLITGRNLAAARTEVADAEAEATQGQNVGAV